MCKKQNDRLTHKNRKNRTVNRSLAAKRDKMNKIADYKEETKIT